MHALSIQPTAFFNQSLLVYASYAMRQFAYVT
jgi:hypothetical protein